MLTEKTFFAILLCLFVVIGRVSAQKRESQPPNIILIFVDDLGYGDLSSYGGKVPTPNMDRIGKEGVRFTDFYASAPVCTPSRYGLLTGRYPQRSKHELINALMPFDKNYLDTSEHTIAWYLKRQNYRTGIVGKWHLGIKDSATRPSQYGFDYFSGSLGGAIDYFNHGYGNMGTDWYVNNRFENQMGYATDLLTKYAIDFIKSTKNAQPFFLYLAYHAPHYGKTDSSRIQPYTLSLGQSDYKGYKNINSLQVPEAYLKRVSFIKDSNQRAYAAMLTALDDNIGKLLTWLEKKNMLENTVIWFMSDNGGYSISLNAYASNGALRGEKAQVWEGGIRVPAMLMWGNHIKAGIDIQYPLCNIDVLPTLLTLAGYREKLPETLDGMDIGPVLKNQQTKERGLFWKYVNQTAYRLGDWKLVNGTELYNLRLDMEEKNNVADRYADKVSELKDLQRKKEEEIRAERERVSGN